MKDLLGLVSPLLDDGPEFIRVQSRGISVSALSLPRALDAMEGIAGLEVIKPPRASNKFWYGARLLYLQVVVALHCLPLGVVKCHAEALTLPVVYPRD